MSPSGQDWLAVGTSLEDPDGKVWLIYDVGQEFVGIEDPDEGVFRLKREDLVRWVDRGDWSVV